MNVKIGKTKNFARLLLACIILSCFAGLVLTPLGKAEESLYTSWGSEYYSGNSWLTCVPHPTGSSFYSASAESFTLSEAQAITKLSFYFYYPTASSSYDDSILNCSIMAGGGAIPASSQGWLEVSSTQYSYSEVSHTQYTVYDFEFSGATYEAGTYWAVVYNTVSAGTTGSGFKIGYDSGGTYGGNHSSYYNSAWGSRSGDLCFYVYTDDGVTPTPTPTPPPSVPEGYISATFATEPSNGVINWYAYASYPDNFVGPPSPFAVFDGHAGTYQIPIGSPLKVNCTAPSGYVFDHYYCTTGEYTFNISTSFLYFEVEADFTVTAVFVDESESNIVELTFPSFTGGYLQVDFGENSSFYYGGLIYVRPSEPLLVTVGTTFNINVVATSGYTFNYIVEAPVNTSIATRLFYSTNVQYEAQYDVSLYASLTLPSGATPTPDISNESITLAWTIGLPLAIVLGCAFGCWYMAGAWGFFAGLNVGVIITFVVLGTAYMPLWAVVVIILVDALLLFGKIGFSRGGGGV